MHLLVKRALWISLQAGKIASFRILGIVVLQSFKGKQLMAVAIATSGCETYALPVPLP